jgi:hypothetical protein
MKQIRELTHSSAWVVLRGSAHVATVQTRMGSGGACQADIWARKPGEKFLSLTHQSKASGYGYDKRTAALSGAVIEGFKLADHCGSVEEKGMKARARLMRAYRADPQRADYQRAREYWAPKLERIGARFANWREGEGFGDAHFAPGLERLERMGFTVICAL